MFTSCNLNTVVYFLIMNNIHIQIHMFLEKSRKYEKYAETAVRYHFMTNS